MRVRESTLIVDQSDNRPDIDARELADQHYNRVLLDGFARDEALPDALVRDAFSRNLLSIRRADADDRHKQYRPFSHLLGDGGRILNVLSGPPVPLDKGSNQRAFNLTWHLNRSGLTTDFLLTAARRRQLPRLTDVLEAIAPRVHTYRNNKPLLPVRNRLRRESERLYRAAGGELGRAPDLFQERLATRNPEGGRRRLTELVSSGRYRAVILNRAWLTGLMDSARQAAPPSTIWICDTHDVQYVRGADQNRRERRLWVDQAAEQRAELAQLRKYDYVLAISTSDAKELRRHLPAERVILAPSGFDYAYQRLPETPAEPPFVYGFIGNAMGPNVEALRLLAQEWWPAIRSIAPGSQLLIAGTICRDREGKRIAADSDGITMLGFVPTLADFYERIDIALNPVLVQGGLNFKSVEAAAAARMLITTPLGMKCLGGSSPAVAAADAAQVAAHVERLSRDPAQLHRLRGESQDWYEQHFSEQAAFAELRSLLKSTG